MSDNQRRVLCRCLFLLVCLLPTAATVYRMAHPQTALGWSRIISAELGVQTAIGDIETPGPYCTVLRDLKFKYADRVLFEALEARLHCGPRRNHVVIPYVNSVKGVDNLGLATLIEQINTHLIQGGTATSHWRIDFEETVSIVRRDGTPREDSTKPALPRFLRDPSAPQVQLQGLRIDIGPTVDGDGVASTVYFKVKQQRQLTETMVLELKSNADGQLVRLDTQGGRLPVWLLDGMMPEVSLSLGRQATFEGRLEVKPFEGVVESLVGEFRDVDVFHGHPVIGDENRLASIEVRVCEYRNGRFERWDADLQGDDFMRTRIDERMMFAETRQVVLHQAIQSAALEAQRRISRGPTFDSQR